jgi:hypothetical protein
MKPILIILFILPIITLAFNEVGENEIKEAHFTGVWKINRYNVDGSDNTIKYIQSHKDYSIYVKPDHQFSETWIESDGAKSITGEWTIDDNGKNIVLIDDEYGQRKYDMNYMYTLRFNNGAEEFILRKI